MSLDFDLHIVCASLSPEEEGPETDYVFGLADTDAPFLDEKRTPIANVSSFVRVTPTEVVFDGTDQRLRANFIRSVLRAANLTTEMAPDLGLEFGYAPVSTALRKWSTEGSAYRSHSIGVIVLLGVVFAPEVLAYGRHTIAVERSEVSPMAVAQLIDKAEAWRMARRSRLEFWEHFCPLISAHEASLPSAEVIARDPTIN